MLSRNSKTVRTMLALVTACGLGGGLVAGCASDDGRGMSASERAARFKPANEAYSTIGYRHVWTGFATMAPGSTVRALDVLGDLVVVRDSSSTVSVIETTSGLTRWSDQLGNPLTKFVGTLRREREVLVSSETEVFGLDVDTGTLINKQRLGKVSNTRPEMVGDLLVYGTADGEIFAQMQPYGFRAWGNSMNGSVTVNPARIGNILAFVAGSGEVLFVDGLSGTGLARGQMFGGAKVDPAASANMAFVASDDQSLYAFAPNSSKPVWRHRTDVVLGFRPVYHDGVVYCTIGSDGLTAFTEFGAAGKGKVLWSCKEASGYVVGMRAGRLVTWDGRFACSIDPANGDLVEKVELGDVAFLGTDKFVDGNLYIVSPMGVVAKLEPR